MSDMELKLQNIHELARRYAQLERQNPKANEETKTIVASMSTCNAVETAYFCQQVISYYGDIHAASMALTVLSNRLLDVLEDGFTA